jgi:hypothetical protein
VPVRSRPIQEGFSDSTTNLRIPRLMRGKSLYPWVRYKSQSEESRNAQCSGGVPEARESSPEDKGTSWERVKNKGMTGKD